MKWLLILLSFILAGRACTATVEIGAPAPPVTVREWIKGGPVEVEPGKIYVIEFWASWCERCRGVIPHMTALQKKFRDRGVVFMALTDEAASVMKIFVKRMGDRMDYAVGIDEQEKMYQTLMSPFGVSAIPYAFVIDKNGLLVWHGDPLGSLEKALEELLAGKFNLQGAIKWDQLRKLQQEYFAKINTLAQREIAKQKAEELLSAGAKEPGVLSEFAWKILLDRNVKHRDLPLALRAAKQAFEASAGKNGAVLDTYARALCENDRPAEAAEIQKSAVFLAQDEEQKIEFEGNLKKYQRLAREKARQN